MLHSLSHFKFIILLVFVCNLGLASGDEVLEDRPNVVVFLSDDQGYGDFSYTGNKDLSTPNIDGLARDGAFAENFYVCPVCSPTRAEFLTGRYHPRGGVYSTSAGGERLDLDERTIAEAFKEAGYATAAFGKWHNGMQAPYHPNSRGFDEYYGFCSGHWGHYFDSMLEHNGELVRGNGYIVDDFTDHAIKFIDDNRNQPFFVYLPYNIPHSPMQVADEYWDKFADKSLTQMPPEFEKAQKQKGKGINHARAALAMCENIDANVGRVLAKLDELKITDNTIVIYFCDNGPNGARYNAGLKGRKGSTDEGGVRSPLFVRWPEKIRPGSKVNQITGAIDLFPTLTQLCGISKENNSKKPFDGVSFHQILLGEQVDQTNRLIFSHWNKKVSVRSQKYRLDHKGVLYDLDADREQKNPVTNMPAEKANLVAAVELWKKDVLAEMQIPPKGKAGKAGGKNGKSHRPIRAFPVGHASMKRTQLPARDAMTTGSLKRSNKFPNCSYITNWIDAADEITWSVNVLETGKYKVEIYYCLREENVGATMQLTYSIQGDEGVVAEVKKKITHAHESKIIGEAEDRSIRGESFVKNFAAFEMGEINLEKSKPGQSQEGILRLRTTEMVDDESIEFRLLMLTRVE